MKMLIAIIQPTKLRAVKQALSRASVQRFTICDGQTFSEHPLPPPHLKPGAASNFESNVQTNPKSKSDRNPESLSAGDPDFEYRAPVQRKIAIEIVVNDDFLERTVSILESVCKTGRSGTDNDGQIFVLPVEQAIQFDSDRQSKGPGAV